MRDILSVFGLIPKSVTLKIPDGYTTVSYLGSNSREFEGLEGLIIDGGTWIDVDHHAGGSPATEKTLQHPGQFTVPEGHHLRGS